MQVEGVNAVNTSSSPAVGQSTAGNEVSAPANVNDSSGGIDASPVENNNLDEEAPVRRAVCRRPIFWVCTTTLLAIMIML